MVVRQRYFPYGQVRSTWGSLPTTYNFTGQRLDGTGLLYYGARYYAPRIGRFVSADSLVPQPGNPQSLNRFSYVLNNPLRYTDPTGHRVCEADPQSCQPQPTPQPSSYYVNAYHILFSSNWEEADIDVILQAALITENALHRVDFVTAQRYGEACLLCGFNARGQAWQAVYGSVTVTWVEQRRGYGAQTFGYRNTIEFYNDAFTVRTLGFHVQHPLHEFGHLFAWHADRQQPYRDLQNTQIIVGGEQIAGGNIRTAHGYQPGYRRGMSLPWQQHAGACCGEDFADMFLNWALNSFANNPAGAARYDWMNANMPRWIALAVSDGR